MMLLAFYKQGDIYISEPALDLRWWIIPPLVDGEKWVLKRAFSESYQQLEGEFDSYGDARRHASKYAWRDASGYGINAGGKAKELRKGRSINRSIITELNEKGRVSYQDMYQLLVDKWGFTVTKSHYMKIIKQMCGLSDFRHVQRQREKVPVVEYAGAFEPSSEHISAFLFENTINTPDGFSHVSNYPVSKRIRIDYAVDQILNGTEIFNHINIIYGDWQHYKDVHYRALPHQIRGDDNLQEHGQGGWAGFRSVNGVAIQPGELLHQIKYTNPGDTNNRWRWKVLREMYNDLVHLSIPLKTFVRYRARWIGDEAFVAFGNYYWAEYGERIDFDRGSQMLTLAEVWKNRNSEKVEQVKQSISFEGVPDD